MEQVQQENHEYKGGDRRRRENDGEQRQPIFDGIELNILIRRKE